MSEPIVTIDQAAHILNVPREYVDRLLGDGKLRFELVGGLKRIRESDLMAYKTVQDQQARAAMRELHEISAELGLYELEPMVKGE